MKGRTPRQDWYLMKQGRGRLATLYCLTDIHL
jgi:hypothetical protein